MERKRLIALFPDRPPVVIAGLSDLADDCGAVKRNNIRLKGGREYGSQDTLIGLENDRNNIESDTKRPRLSVMADRR